MALNLDTLGLAATVTASGISAPDYQTILSKITGFFQQIYGTDAYLDPDSKDGQMVALVSLAINDANNTAVEVYDSFSPSTAKSDALTRNVKINGITRNGATNSTVDLVLSGTAGTTITNGLVKDTNGILWNLPAKTTIGTGGTVTVTATCGSSGAVSAVSGSVNQINTPTRGWVSASNPNAATVGTPAETDSQLRARQAQSVALPSVTPFDALDGSVASVSGVTRHKLYENDTGTTDSNGIPAHSVAVIVDGGDATEIANTIRAKKGQGVSTFGDTSVVVGDAYGNPHSISLSRSVDVPVIIRINLKVFTGYTSQIADEIKAQLVAYINGLTIGSNVLLSRLYSPANLGVVSGGDSKYYDIDEMTIGRTADSLAAANIVVAYNEAASCTTDNISIAVV